MDGEEIFDELDEAEEKIQNLKDQRNKLIEANKALLHLVEKMESETDFEEQGFQYSFKDGWRDSEVMRGLKLNPEDYSEDELERQVNEIVKMVNQVDNI